MALDLARRELELREIPYIKNSLHANYSYKSISIGSKQGWLISAKLKVPETFEPDMIFIENLTQKVLLIFLMYYKLR